MKLKLVLTALALAITTTVTPSYAAPAEQACPLTTMPQHDMAGIYVDSSLPMRVQVYPCSGVRVLWDNAYGRHEAYYQMNERLPGGGIIGHGDNPDARTGYLDNAYTLAVKPGEPGTIEIITVSPYGQILAVYRLPKVA